MAGGTLTEGQVARMRVTLCLKPCQLDLLVAAHSLQERQGSFLVQGLHGLEQAASGRMGSHLTPYA